MPFIRVAACCLGFASLVEVGFAQVAVLPGSPQAGGVVDDQGQATLVVRIGAQATDATPGAASGEVMLVLVRGGRVDTVPLGPNYAGLGLLRFLEGGDILLGGYRRAAAGRPAANVLEIVRVRGGNKVSRIWSWNSREEYSDCQNHCVAPVISSDGGMWGHADRSDDKGTRVTFTMGRTRASRASPQTRAVDLPAVDKGQQPMWGHFWFLDNDGSVVLAPWSGGGYIVRFNSGAAPRSAALLQGDGEWNFTWQQEERILWAAKGTELRAYHLWDLGASGFPEEPFWEFDAIEGWQPSEERGAARIVAENGGYRVEHRRREPWTGFEERHVSPLIAGAASPGGLGRDVLVSPNGRHAVILEPDPSDEEGVRARARTVRMQLSSAMPAAEQSQADSEAGEDETANNGQR